MRVLIACEFSGVVREAFRQRGHNAWSCDLLPTEQPGSHYQGDVRDIIDAGWDLMIAHPPCTHLAVSGARHFKGKEQLQEDALAFIRLLLNAPIPRIALENPVSIISTRIRKPDQIVQPWMFGHRKLKKTCFWLKNLSKLAPTNVVGPPPKDMLPEEKASWNETWYQSPGADRGKRRSVTFQGIANAMAEQWGELAE